MCMPAHAFRSVHLRRAHLDGDPNTWNRMLYSLKLVADAAQTRGAGIVVAVVQGPQHGELPMDRVQAVAHNLSVDKRWVVAGGHAAC